MEGLAQRNGGIKCKKEEKPTAADCLQGAEGQTAPAVTNQKIDDDGDIDDIDDDADDDDDVDYGDYADNDNDDG